MGLAAFTLELERRVHTALRARADQRAALRADADVNPEIRRKPEHLLTGERGEDAAFFYLRKLGYTIVARRWRSRRLPGDLDLIAWDGPTLVIVEVKTQTARGLMAAEAQVDEHKKNTLRKMAAAYLNHLPEMHRLAVAVRFDIVSVYFLPGGTEFEHLRNAFPRTATHAARWL